MSEGLTGENNMTREVRKINTPYYNYINLNPKGKFGSDCVVRAVALALDMSWEEAVRDMTEFGIKKGFVLNDVKLIPLYLKEKGFREMKEPKDHDNHKYACKDWLNTYEYHLWRNYSIIANVGPHHTICIKDGKVQDTWNSSSCTIHKWWIKL